MKLIPACLACSTLLFTGPTLAYGSSNNTGPSGFVAAGAGVAPAFEGTDEYEAIPFVFGHVKWRGIDTRLSGAGLEFDLLDNSALDIGPVINYRTKRNSSDGSGRVRYLSDVKGAAELGGFIAYRFGGDRLGQDQITLGLSGVHDINDAYDGVLITGRVSYAALRSRKVTIDVDAQTTWADENYQRTYFGISPGDAARSGLSIYRPDSGFRDVTAGVTLGYQLTQRWGLIARGSLTRYVGDTADSPIVHEGSKTVGLMGLAASYRF